MLPSEACPKSYRLQLCATIARPMPCTPMTNTAAVQPGPLSKLFSIPSSSLRFIASTLTDPLGHKTGSQIPYPTQKAFPLASAAHKRAQNVRGAEKCWWEAMACCPPWAHCPTSSKVHISEPCPTYHAKPCWPRPKEGSAAVAVIRKTLFWHAARASWLPVSSSLEKAELRAWLANYVVQLLS